MNKTTTVSDGQSLVDVALQELGSIEALFDLADAGGLAITDLLSAGQVLAVPASSTAQAGLINYYARRNQRVNTGDETPPQLVATTQQYFSSQFFKPDYFA